MAARRWTLRRRMTALSIVVAFLLGLLAVLAAGTAAINLDRVHAVVDIYSPLRADSEELLAALVSQETGIRGYMLSGRSEELAPYRDGIADESRLVEEMGRQLAGQAVALQRLATVRDAASRWRARIAEPIIAAVQTGGPQAGQALVTEAGRQEFAMLRARVGEFQEEIFRLSNQAADDAKQASGILVALLVVAASIVVVAGIALVILQERLVARPVTELAADVRTVAGGDYHHEIASHGPPELTRLARDVDGMRRQIVRDLAEVTTARARIEEINATLEAQAAELTRSNRDLEQFAYVASHDLQEPLRKVASFCQLLQRRYAGQLDERADQYIAFAVNGAQRMQRLINDLLAFSRIGRVAAGFSEVDLDAVMAETVSSLDTLVERTNAEITWTDLPVVMGEEPLLATLLSNLVSNSVKFRRPDTPPRVHVSAQPSDNGDGWVITCADNGIGIDTQYADKVFVIFQRLHPREAYPGTGIGLAIAKKIVEYHSGRIWIDPDHGEGTTIRFTLPMSDTIEETP